MDYILALKAKENSDIVMKKERMKWGIITLIILAILLETAGSLITVILIMIGLVIVFSPVFFLPLSSLGAKERKTLVLYNEIYEKENKGN